MFYMCTEYVVLSPPFWFHFGGVLSLTHCLFFFLNGGSPSQQVWPRVFFPFSFFLPGTSIPYSKPPFWWVSEFEPSPIPTIISEFHLLFQPSYRSFIPYSNHHIGVSSPIPTIISWVSSPIPTIIGSMVDALWHRPCSSRNFPLTWWCHFEKHSSVAVEFDTICSPLANQSQKFKYKKVYKLWNWYPRLKNSKESIYFFLSFSSRKSEPEIQIYKVCKALKKLKSKTQKFNGNVRGRRWKLLSPIFTDRLDQNELLLWTAL